MQKTELFQQAEKVYVERGGLKCLICGSDELSPIEYGVTDDHDITQDIGCLECGNTWTDIYKLHSVIYEAEKW